MNTIPVSSEVLEKSRKFFGGEFQSAQVSAISRTFTTWSWMLRRCFDACDPGYPNYGGRGITVCERWFVFASFLKDMGLRAEDRTLDRIDNDGDYEPGNCKWSTKTEQARNKRGTRRAQVNGQEMLHVDIARSIGVSESTVCRRSARGISGDALTQVRNFKRVKLNSDQAKEIKALLAGGAHRAVIADQFQVSVQLIGNIARGTAWKDVTC